MKQKKGATKAHASHMPLEKGRFPLGAQAGATPSRDAVRAEYPVRAPRQTKRRVERTHKSQTAKDY